MGDSVQYRQQVDIYMYLLVRVGAICKYSTFDTPNDITCTVLYISDSVLKPYTIQISGLVSNHFLSDYSQYCDCVVVVRVVNAVVAEYINVKQSY